MKSNEITDNTIILAEDMVGGLSHRLMLGRQGLVANANATLECWKFNGVDGVEEFKPIPMKSTYTQEELNQAVHYLLSDNFVLHIIEPNKTYLVSNMIIGRNIVNLDEVLLENPNPVTILDLDKIEFNEEGLYTIY